MCKDGDVRDSCRMLLTVPKFEAVGLLVAKADGILDTRRLNE